MVIECSECSIRTFYLAEKKSSHVFLNQNGAQRKSQESKVNSFRKFDKMQLRQDKKKKEDSNIV